MFYNTKLVHKREYYATVARGMYASEKQEVLLRQRSYLTIFTLPVKIL